jgi:hypothetical protein
MRKSGRKDTSRRAGMLGLPGICCATVMVALLAGSSAVFAQEGNEYRGTASQQAACTSDVFRLCWSEIPDVSRIVLCLKRERPRLSSGCRMVFQPRSHSIRVVGKKRLRHYHNVSAE